MNASRGQGRGRSLPMGWYLAGWVISWLWRFCAGQVVLRRAGRWDARYLTPAVAIPDNAYLTRAEGFPRTRWARRPGWHRQLARLGAIVLLVGWLVAPVLTVATVATVAAVIGLRRALDWRDLAYYRRVCGKFLQWTTSRMTWDDLDPDPRKWIELPPYRWVWVPVAPLRAALLRSGDESVPDGWLVRFAPWLAGWLAPLTVPVTEWRVVGWLVDGRPGRRRPAAVVLRLVGRLVIRLGELSRRARVLPRLVAPDLSNPDARIVIHYPATYQAHGADLAEVERVVCSRMPFGPWQFRHNADDLTVEVYHPATLPRYVAWDRSMFAGYSQLEIPVGVRAAGETVVIDLKAETPHVNVSGKTGRGKTITFLVALGSFLYHGGHAVVIDPKRVDFVRPFRGLGNVDLVTVKARFPTTLRDVIAEMDRRYEVMEHCTQRADELGMPAMEQNAELYFQPLMCAIDEKSGFTAICREWWQREGQDGKPGKGLPVTVTLERDGVARGRAAGVFLMAAAQQNSIPNVFPDTDIRSNYQYKILAGPSDGPSWMVTFPGERKRRLSSDVKGRAIVGAGSELYEAQLAFMETSEVREAAIHGLEVRDKLNRERAERLALVSGEPLWSVSPLPWWVPAPAETAEGVPGRGDGMDGAGDPVQAEPAALTLVAAGAGGEPVEVAAGADSEEAESNECSNTDSVPAMAGDRFRGPSRAVELIRGNRGAAEYLGVSFEAFRKARSRAEQAGAGIPGMSTDGRFVVFDAVQLAEWWNQRPGSGRKAG